MSETNKMAQKDWKKIGEMRWKKNNIIIGVIYPSLVLGKNKYILVEKDAVGVERIRRLPASKSQALNFATYMPDETMHYFKTKSQALKFVHQYMRTH